MGLGINAVTQNVTRSDSEQALPAAGQAFTLTSAAGATPTFAALTASGTNSAATTIPLTGATQKTYTAVVSGATITTGVIQMQGSDDGVNWFNTGSTLTVSGLTVGSSVSVQSDTQSWRLYRAQVTTTFVGASAAVTVWVIV